MRVHNLERDRFSYATECLNGPECEGEHREFLDVEQVLAVMKRHMHYCDFDRAVKELESLGAPTHAQESNNSRLRARTETARAGECD